MSCHARDMSRDILSPVWSIWCPCRYWSQSERDLRRVGGQTSSRDGDEVGACSVKESEGWKIAKGGFSRVRTQRMRAFHESLHG
jgi:hypothetical protein